MDDIDQQDMFDNRAIGGSSPDVTPAHEWQKDAAKRALDELFSLARQYKSSDAYHKLLKFIVHFRSYSPFNAMLAHIQMPGATYVAPPHRWLRDYRRRIKPGARPLIILQPMGPVMFVFDVSETEPTENAPPLPPEIERPFEVRRGRIGDALETVSENAKRDGVRIVTSRDGSQSAGSISPVSADIHSSQKIRSGTDKNRTPIYTGIPVKYDMLTNSNLSREAQYATIVHELAHLYCGHLGTPNDRWWPDRRGLSHVIMELEAESVSYMVCGRAGIDTPSERYLADYARRESQTASISLECVMKAAGLIESMSRQRLKPRKED